MYRIGKSFAERYKDYLTFSPRDIYVRSSDADRCLESAQMFVAGMYPPDRKYVCNIREFKKFVTQLFQLAMESRTRPILAANSNQNCL